MRTTPFIALLTLVSLAMSVQGCDSGAKQNEGKKGASDKDDDKDDDKDRADGEGNGTAVELKGDADFDGWCAKAAKTKPVQGDLKDLFGDLCNGSKATDLFKTGLLGVTYQGEGEPQLKAIEALGSDKATKETRFHFGVAIKLPISAATHFNKVGPRAGDEAAQKELAEASGATAEVDIKKTYKKDGTNHVRGWLVYAKVSKKTSGINVITETETRSDQFQLEEDKHFLYTQHVTKAVQTVKKFDMVTAGIQAGADAYLLTVVSVVVNNKSFASTAEKELKKTATTTIKEMYRTAAEAQ